MTEQQTDIDIPEFIELVSNQIRESIKRFEESGQSPLLYFGGLQLQIAFTAEETSGKNARVELKPWIFSAGGGVKKDDREAIVHTVTIDLTPSPVSGTHAEDVSDTETAALHEIGHSLGLAHSLAHSKLEGVVEQFEKEHNVSKDEGWKTVERAFANPGRSED
jgi:hypothetical protein